MTLSFLGEEKKNKVILEKKAKYYKTILQYEVIGMGSLLDFPMHGTSWIT